MKKDYLKAIVEALIHEIEEEDIGISLFTTFYQNESELCFFSKPDREKVLKILQILSEDSRRHKEILGKLICYLEKSRRKK